MLSVYPALINFRMAASIFTKPGIYTYTVTCRVVRATKMTGSSPDDWIY
jgi:hypothetical protein